MVNKIKCAHILVKKQSEALAIQERLKQGEKFYDELDVRRDILAGTDIPVNKTKSDDGSQSTDSWNVGNIQYIEIKGLPN